MLPTRPFEPSYSEAELAEQRAQEAADEAQGIYDHLDAELYGLTPAQPLQEEWCRSCRVWRPPRAAHCYACARCVLRSDHHCALLGNCVGLKNHRFFLLFVTLVGTGALTLAVSTMLLISQQLQSEGLSSSVALSFLLLVIFSLSSLVLLIARFHASLLLWDVTLRERYGRKRAERHAGRLRTRQKLREVWRQIGAVEFGWKDMDAWVQRKRGHNAAQASATPNGAALSAGSVALNIHAGDAEEQIRCVPPMETGKDK